MLEYYKDGRRDMNICGFCVCVEFKYTSLDELKSSIYYTCMCA